MSFIGIAFCPVCCSNVDLEGEPGSEVELECITCEQKWRMLLDPDRFATYSIS